MYFRVSYTGRVGVVWSLLRVTAKVARCELDTVHALAGIYFAIFGWQEPILRSSRISTVDTNITKTLSPIWHKTQAKTPLTN
jgi:hypothetical protein